MNCRGFQHDLYEYLEGSLSPGAQAAAEKHLAECAACRQMAGQERQAAQALSERFRRETDSLKLPAEVRQRVLSALADGRRGADEERGNVFFWRRVAWPLALAASLLLLVAGWELLLRAPGSGKGHPQPQLAGGEISVQFSYIVPTYSFRKEGGLVIDALTYQTNVVNERLHTEVARLQ